MTAPRNSYGCRGGCGSHTHCSNNDKRTPSPNETGERCEPCYWGPRFDAMYRSKGVKVPKLNIR